MASQTRSVCNTISSAWADPDNAFSEDDLCTSTKGDGNQNVYNFSGNPFTIPDGSIIDGITVKTVRGGDDNDYYTIELQDADPAWRPKTGTAYLGNCASGLDEILGGVADKWGGNFTQSHINSTSFQVRLTYTKTAKANILYIDYIEVTIYYSEAPPTEKNTSDTGGGSDSLLKERETSIITFGSGNEVTLKEREVTVALSGGGAVLLLPLKERGLSDIGGGSEGLTKFVLAEKFIGDVGGGVDAISLLKTISKSVSDIAGGVVALIRERDIFLVETASGLVALLKERFITVSELGGGSDATVRSAVLSKAVGDVGGGAELASKETGIVKKKRKRGWPWQYR